MSSDVVTLLLDQSLYLIKYTVEHV